MRVSSSLQTLLVGVSITGALAAQVRDLGDDRRRRELSLCRARVVEGAERLYRYGLYS